MHPVFAQHAVCGAGPTPHTTLTGVVTAHTRWITQPICCCCTYCHHLQCQSLAPGFTVFPCHGAACCRLQRMMGPARRGGRSCLYLTWQAKYDDLLAADECLEVDLCGLIVVVEHQQLGVCVEGQRVALLDGLALLDCRRGRAPGDGGGCGGWDMSMGVCTHQLCTTCFCLVSQTSQSFLASQWPG